MLKMECIVLICLLCSRGVFFSLTCIWIHLCSSRFEFSSFPLFLFCFVFSLFCALRRENSRNYLLSGSTGGLLRRKEVGNSAVMCRHSGAKTRCLSCVQHLKFAGMEARLCCVLSLCSGEISEAVLSAFHKCKTSYSAVLGWYCMI